MKKAATVAEYLRAVPPKQRAALQKVRKAIHAAAPGSVEAISYGIPAFKYRGRMLIYFAAFKNHNSVYPASKASSPRIGRSSRATSLRQGNPAVRRPRSRCPSGC